MQADGEQFVPCGGLRHHRILSTIAAMTAKPAGGNDLLPYIAAALA
jgi:hypothetical protein